MASHERERLEVRLTSREAREIALSHPVAIA